MNWRKIFHNKENSNMGNDLQKEMAGPVGQMTYKLMNDFLKRIPPKVSFSQDIIKNIVTEAICNGARSQNIINYLKDKFPYTNQEELAYSVKSIVNASRTNFNRARQQIYVGDWYIWGACGGRRGDGRTRKSHRNMSDVIINWNDPPSPEELAGEVSIGKYHAGEIGDCRCYTRPIIDIDGDYLKWPMRIYRNGQITKINKTDFKKIFNQNSPSVITKGGNSMQFCQYCSRQVQGKKTVNWFVLLVMCLITGGGWLFLYLPYYIFFKSPSCPICGAKL